MLRKLTIENFFSVREAQTLDLKIARNAPDIDKRFATPVSDSDDRFPRVVVIYGANASGKTNILKAISFLASFVKNSFDYKPDQNIPIINFQSKAWIQLPFRFEVEFDAQVFESQEGRARYLYELIISHDGNEVLYEVLKHFPMGQRKRLFERNKQETIFSKEFGISENDPISERIRKNASVISTLAKFNHPIATAFYNNLESVMSDVSVSGKIDFANDVATTHYSRSSLAFEALNNEIRRLDLGIEKITLEESQNGIRPYFFHKGLDVGLNYSLESQGTQNFYNLFPYLYYVLETGGIAVLDELGSDVHPLLLPELVQTFQQKITNPHDAQLIISCHNASLLEHLSKEEIFFTEKDVNGGTEIYGLKEISGVRRDTNIYAKYLSGVFGGVPNIG